MGTGRRTLRILGIDPGSHVTGWGLLTGPSHRPELELSGCIRLDRRTAFAARLARLHDEIARTLIATRPDMACVEAPFHGVNPRSALQLAHARGVILAAAGQARVEVVELAPASVKRAVVGSGRADKEQVHAMVVRLLRLTAPIENTDVSDAVAVAYAYLAGEATRSAIARAVDADPRTGRSTVGHRRPPRSR